MQLSNSQKAIQRRVYHHVIKRMHTFFTIVQPGFEQIAFNELLHMGIKPLAITKGGIVFRGNLYDSYKANMFSRVATRIIMRLTEFMALHFNEIYRTLRNFPWELYISSGTSIAIEVSVHKSKLHHTDRIGKEVLNAIEKRMNDFALHINTDQYRVQTIYIRFDHDQCGVSMDTTGDPLYKRGYKQHVGRAPLRETIAAALLYECDITSYDVIIDPMCGSGTFPLEAWCMTNNFFPGINRAFAFMHWPSFRKEACNSLASSLSRGNYGATILAGDRDPSMVTIAKNNCTILGAAITTYSGDFLTEKLTIEEKHILCTMNPPYGKRIADDDTAGIYSRLSYIFENWYPAWSFCIIIPLSLRHVFTVPVTKEIRFNNGGLPVIALIGRER